MASLQMMPTRPPTLEYFNEMYDSAGQLRPAYERWVKFACELSPLKIQQFEEKSRAKTLGVYSLSAHPLLLTESEMSLIARGVRQRAHVMQMFLTDHFSGRCAYAAEKLFAPKMVRDLCKRWLLNPDFVLTDDFSMVYGPDLIRDVRGEWTLFEDNCTIVAGLLHSEMNREIWLGENDAYRSEIGSNADESFYPELFTHLRARAEGGEVVQLMYDIPQALNSFSGKARLVNSDRRFAALKLAKYNASIVAVNPLFARGGWNAEMGAWRRLEVASDLQVNIVTRSLAGRKLDSRRVGAIFVDVCLDHIFARWAVPGLAEAYRARKVRLSHTPGVELFNDKIWYPYMDRLIEFYLREKPIIKSIETVRFSKLGAERELDRETLSGVFENISNWVLKDVQGAGGSHVWLGYELEGDVVSQGKLKQEIELRPHRFLAQKFVQSSRLEGVMIDFRPMSLVEPSGITVSRALRSRGIRPTGDGGGKHNVGANVGRSIQPAVFVVKD